MSLLIRNNLYPVDSLEIGDRFHIAGNKSKLGTVQEFTYANEREQFLGNKYRVVVMMDGEQFTKSFKPEKEVVYLRSL